MFKINFYEAIRWDFFFSLHFFRIMTNVRFSSVILGISARIQCYSQWIFYRSKNEFFPLNLAVKFPSHYLNVENPFLSTWKYWLVFGTNFRRQQIGSKMEMRQKKTHFFSLANYTWKYVVDSPDSSIVQHYWLASYSQPDFVDSILNGCNISNWM